MLSLCLHGSSGSPFSQDNSPCGRHSLRLCFSFCFQHFSVLVLSMLLFLPTIWVATSADIETIFWHYKHFCFCSISISSRQCEIFIVTCCAAFWFPHSVQFIYIYVVSFILLYFIWLVLSQVFQAVPKDFLLIWLKALFCLKLFWKYLCKSLYVYEW